jgi:hypothetical protein
VIATSFVLNLLAFAVELGYRVKESSCPAEGDTVGTRCQKFAAVLFSNMLIMLGRAVETSICRERTHPQYSENRSDPNHMRLRMSFLKFSSILLE